MGGGVPARFLFYLDGRLRLPAFRCKNGTEGSRQLPQEHYPQRSAAGVARCQHRVNSPTQKLRYQRSAFSLDKNTTNGRLPPERATLPTLPQRRRRSNLEPLALELAAARDVRLDSGGLAPVGVGLAGADIPNLRTQWDVGLGWVGATWSARSSRLHGYR